MQKMVLLPYERYQRLLSDKQVLASTYKGDDTEEKQEKSLETNNADDWTESQSSQIKDIGEIIALFPKTLQGRARALLTYILPYISWNEKGEVTLSGKVIPNSNIVDLLKVQLKTYKDFRPAGLLEFESLLTNINVPQSLLSASRRKQIGGLYLPPPPGIPVESKRSKEDDRYLPNTKPTKIKWLRL